MAWERCCSGVIFVITPAAGALLPLWLDTYMGGAQPEPQGVAAPLPALLLLPDIGMSPVAAANLPPPPTPHLGTSSPDAPFSPPSAN